MDDKIERRKFRIAETNRKLEEAYAKKAKENALGGKKIKEEAAATEREIADTTATKMKAKEETADSAAKEKIEEEKKRSGGNAKGTEGEEIKRIGKEKQKKELFLFKKS